MNISSKAPQSPNFGRISADQKSIKVFKETLTLPQWKEFDTLIKSQKRNPHDIKMTTLGDSGVLTGFVKGNGRLREIQILSSKSTSPIEFVKDLCNKANRLKSEDVNVSIDKILKQV